MTTLQSFSIIQDTYSSWRLSAPVRTNTAVSFLNTEHLTSSKDNRFYTTIEILTVLHDAA